MAKLHTGLEGRSVRGVGGVGEDEAEGAAARGGARHAFVVPCGVKGAVDVLAHLACGAARRARLLSQQRG